MSYAHITHAPLYLRNYLRYANVISKSCLRDQFRAHGKKTHLQYSMHLMPMHLNVLPL